LSETVLSGAALQAVKREQTVFYGSQNLVRLWANFDVLHIVPYKEVLARQMSLESPTETALACHLAIGAPTVTHEPGSPPRMKIMRPFSGESLMSLALTTTHENL
jgi:hypothetical protein